MFGVYWTHSSLGYINKKKWFFFCRSYQLSLMLTESLTSHFNMRQYDSKFSLLAQSTRGFQTLFNFSSLKHLIKHKHTHNAKLTLGPPAGLAPLTRPHSSWRLQGPTWRWWRSWHSTPPTWTGGPRTTGVGPSSTRSPTSGPSLVLSRLRHSRLYICMTPTYVVVV